MRSARNPLFCSRAERRADVASRGLLDRLADTVGIEERYWDIHGQVHERSPETTRLLLAALGFDVESDADAEASLRALTETRTPRPPVVVSTDEEHIAIPVLAPAGDAGRRQRWDIVLEDGAQLSGTFVAADLPLAQPSGELRRLSLPALSTGYHRLRLNDGEQETQLIVAPRRCYLPADWNSRRFWGVVAQLYSIRSRNNWGIGDFSDLAMLADWLARAGADTIGVNPLHALFLDDPDNASPYSPNSRLFLNPLYLDPAVMTGADPPHAAAEPGDAIIDYRHVAARKREAFERAYAAFIAGNGAASTAFRAFVAKSGRGLQDFAVFQMLAERFDTHRWSEWPRAFQDPRSREVGEAVAAAQARIGFFQFLQWQCDLQAANAAETMRMAGMKIGLYKDLAISIDSASADRWADQSSFLAGAEVGAPPDLFNTAGQAWGIVPPNPLHWRASAYAHFIALLRANMRNAGALRIDHVMGLLRLYVIPHGISTRDGVYLRMPLDDLVAITALESHRNKCLAIGEDLGTVPMGFRERMAEANVLSMKILYFEQEHGRFRRPREFPPQAAISAATHDLPTLKGYWTAADIAARLALGLSTPGDAARAMEDRARDKAALLAALRDEGLLPREIDAEPPREVAWTPALGEAVHRYLARASSKLCLIQLDDIAGEERQANLPGSTESYPSWRRRLHRSLEDLARDEIVTQTLAAVAAERTRD